MSRPHPALPLFLLCSTLSLAQGPGRPAPPRLALQALDLDHDGTLSPAEILAAPTSLLTLDRNGDGILTADELAERPTNAGASADELLAQLMAFDKTNKGYLTAEDLPTRMQGMFRRADTDHDGRVTPAEIRALSARQGMPIGTPVSPGAAGGIFRFDAILFALDTNHDGVLSAQELANAPASLLTLDKNHDGTLTPNEIPLRQQTPDERAEHLLDEYDTNKDGHLTRAEAPERMAPQFDQIDTDHDGVLTRPELVEYFRTQASQPRPAPTAATKP